MAEYYWMSVSDNAKINTPPYIAQPEPYEAEAYFAQMSYRVLQRTTLVMRYESLDFEANSTFFDVIGLRPTQRSTLGLNFDMNSSMSLRFEYYETRRDNQDTNSFSIQWFVLLV